MTAATDSSTRVVGLPSREADDANGVPAYVWLFLGSLVFNMFSGYSNYLGFPIGPDRILFAGAVGLLLLDPRVERLRFKPVYVIMAVLVVWTACSALSHGVLLETAKAYALLDRIIVPFLMFCLGPLIFTTSRRRVMLLKTLCLIGIYLGLTAIFEIIGPNSLVWPSYIMDPNIGILFGRARGPFASAEPNGMTMGLALFASSILYTKLRGGWRRVALVGIVLSALGTILCLTRSVWLATVVALVVIGYILPEIRRRLPALIASFVGVVAFILLAVPPIANPLIERFTMESSLYDRQNTNAAGLRIIAESPIFGIGWGRYLDVGANWIRQADTYPVTNINIEIHNTFLSRAAETGLPGALMWILCVALGPALFLVVNRPARSSERFVWWLMLIAATCYWFFPSMSSPNPYPLPNNLFWLIGGIVGRQFMVLPRADEIAADVPEPTTAAAVVGSDEGEI